MELSTTQPGSPVSLAAALTAEHEAIDAGLEAFVAQSEDGDVTQWAAPLQEAMRALRRHIYLEEEVAFPRLRKGPLMMPVLVMLREHGEIWRAMDELDALLAAPDSQTEPARSALVAACHAMLALLDEHNAKEEPIIYPHLDTTLDWVAQAHLRELIEEGTLPEGWVCERAAA